MQGHGESRENPDRNQMHRILLRHVILPPIWENEAKVQTIKRSTDRAEEEAPEALVPAALVVEWKPESKD